MPKIGRDLETLATEIERQAQQKVDYRARTKSVQMIAHASGARLHSDKFDVDIRPHTHQQIAAYCNIHGDYYRKMNQGDLAHSKLLAQNVNFWMDRAIDSKGVPDTRLYRMLDGACRALLSPTYRTMENIDLANALVPTLNDIGAEIVSCELTEARFYVKAAAKHVVHELRRQGKELGKGHDRFAGVVCPAIVVSNSEVGKGFLDVQTSVWEEGCTNLTVMRESGLKRRHVGKRHSLDEGVDIAAMLSDQTRALDDAALWSRVRDVVIGSFDEVQFRNRCKVIEGAADDQFDADPIQVVTNVCARFSFNQDEQKLVMNHLMAGTGSGGKTDLTRWGLSRAITRAAEDVADYERASELELNGGDLVELPRSAWRELVNVAA